MAGFFRGVLSGTVIALSLLDGPLAIAADDRGIAGDYICKSGCRLTDAPPGIVIDGAIARCMNELGGVYTGTTLTNTSVSCFNRTGTLAKDGKTILWSNGDVWERRPQRPGQP